MNTVLAIFKKEFVSFFISPIAYIFITVYLAVTNFLYFQTFFLVNQVEMRSYFSLLPWVFLFLVPAITMRSWAEEKKVKTLELLLTWPVSDVQVVLGKFLASFSFLAIVILLSLTIPVTLMILGNPDPGPIIGGYLGAILMGAAYLSIGLWVSSHTENQIVAFILGLVAIFILIMIGSPFMTLRMPSAMVPILSHLSLANHFESIERGVIDSRNIIYYLSVIGFFLFLNVQSLGSRKYE
ncbi:ABC transporter permease subunit [Chitinispirillales bacterium ANBcel5]|uniref:ABC transporter permease n=1 Tax=Cellulosispirillum alkaliphilum TaxID=3039283 RepID=UPI002A562E5C|nr:ABC transporter permease subunit [Chitinispirillales bacterium ANBcel5]